MALEGIGGLTGWPIMQEISLVLGLLMVTVLMLVYGVSGLIGGGKGDSFSPVILSDVQREQVDSLVLPKAYMIDTWSKKGSKKLEEEENAEQKGEAEEHSMVPENAPTLRRASSSAATAWDLATLKMKDMLGVRNKDDIRYKFQLERYVQDGHTVRRTPLLVFVNRKSGGQNGDLLLQQLNMFLPPWQVWDIGSNGGPDTGLKCFRDVPNFRVLVAGGDGTAAWVLETIDSLDMPYQPPVAVLPVGTGNDLARILGWGGGLSGGGYAGNGLARQLLDTVQGEIVMLDRWKVECVSDTHPDDTNTRSNSNRKKGKKTGWKKTLVLNNYLGIGVDAQISLNFHENREASPHLFTSRFINKYVWYVQSGGKEILFQRFSELSKNVRLECDGKHVPLPPGSEGIIILNIRSYGGGVDLWGVDDDDLDEFNDDIGGDSGVKLDANGHPSSPGGSARSRMRHPSSPSQATSRKRGNSFGKKQQFRLASFSDGFLEVVSVSSSLQLGAAQVGLARPTRICQCRSVKIEATNMTLPLQVDGEPFTLPSSASIGVSFLNQGVMLAKGHTTRKQLMPVGEANKVIDDVLEWAQSARVLDETQKKVLRKEFMSRLYTRRRVVSSESAGM